jgi:hypothetical protein
MEELESYELCWMARINTPDRKRRTEVLGFVEVYRPSPFADCLVVQTTFWVPEPHRPQAKIILVERGAKHSTVYEEMWPLVRAFISERYQFSEEIIEWVK